MLTILSAVESVSQPARHMVRSRMGLRAIDIVTGVDLDSKPHFLRRAVSQRTGSVQAVPQGLLLTRRF